MPLSVLHESRWWEVREDLNALECVQKLWLERGRESASSRRRRCWRVKLLCHSVNTASKRERRAHVSESLGWVIFDPYSWRQKGRTVHLMYHHWYERCFFVHQSLSVSSRVNVYLLWMWMCLCIHDFPLIRYWCCLYCVYVAVALFSLF